MRITVVSAHDWAFVSVSRYAVGGMIDVQIKDTTKPEVLAELIEATLHGHIPTNPDSSAAQVGKLVREQQAEAEARRLSRNDLQTFSFQTIDPDEDWSEV